MGPGYGFTMPEELFLDGEDAASAAEDDGIDLREKAELTCSRGRDFYLESPLDVLT